MRNSPNLISDPVISTNETKNDPKDVFIGLPSRSINITTFAEEIDLAATRNDPIVWNVGTLAASTSLAAAFYPRTQPHIENY
ncbi:MAG: hypothetical protein OSA89_02150 [Mariniblastus sp.]|nr:hypothetical protein [Mariniblastus sp.]